MPPVITSTLPSDAARKKPAMRNPPMASFENGIRGFLHIIRIAPAAGEWNIVGMLPTRFRTDKESSDAPEKNHRDEVHQLPYPTSVGSRREQA